MKPYFERGGIRLFHADARDAIEDVVVDGSVDLLLTDPPYGMQYEGQGAAAQANIKGDGARQGMRVFRQVLLAMAHTWKADAHAYVFCHWEGRVEAALVAAERAVERVELAAEGSAAVTPAERRDLEAWAKREGRPLAALLREVGVRSARRSAA